MLIEVLKFVGYHKFVQTSTNFKISVSILTYTSNSALYCLTMAHRDQNT